MEFNGPVMPPAETHRPPDRQTVAGYPSGSSIDFVSHPIEDFKADKDEGNIDLTSKDNTHARWAGLASNYFGAVILPDDPTLNGAPGKPDFIASIIAHGINVEKDVAMDDHNAYVTFQTQPIPHIEPHKLAALPMSVYLGPKWRDILEKPYYVGFPRAYNLLLAVRSSMCGITFCKFGWIVSFMIGLLTLMQTIFGQDLGAWRSSAWSRSKCACFCIPSLRRSQMISMAKMSKMLCPEMKRLQEKYKDDKEELNKAMVEFHRQQGLGPYLGCLPMFLQTPIWIALYGVLQTTFELRQAPFLFGWTWIKDLSQPDYIIKLARTRCLRTGHTCRRFAACLCCRF